MSGQPAARIGDMIACATPQATPAALPHAPTGSPIIGLGASTVLIGGNPAARMNDFSVCLSPAPVPNFVMKGAFPVPIMNMPAARMTDQGTPPHTGVILPPCCATVLIGLSGTTGNPHAGNLACQALANGRAGNTSGQSYNNCGIESSRQIINQANGSSISEDALMQTAKNTPAINTSSSIGTPGAANLFAEGGTTARQQVALLNNAGVASSRIAPVAGNNGIRLTQFELPLSQGRGIIAHGDVSGFPASQGYGSQPVMRGHAVTVTGMTYDDDGKVTHVHFNDTNSMCNQKLTRAEFESFLNTFSVRASANGLTPPNAVITNNPIW